LRKGQAQKRAGAGSAICIADYESIEQLTLDLSVMPGAGIASIEVVPFPDDYPTPEGNYPGLRRLTYEGTREMMAPAESQKASKNWPIGK
jgi:hypothetical protein